MLENAPERSDTPPQTCIKLHQTSIKRSRAGNLKENSVNQQSVKQKKLTRQDLLTSSLLHQH